MTATDKLAFAQAFNRLAVETRLPAKDADAATQQIYFDGLIDFPIEAVTEAAHTLGRKAEWFPKLKEWRDAAKRVRRDAVNKLPAERPQLTGTVETPTPSVAVTDLQEAMDDYLTMRAAGVSREDACKGLEGLLRALIPIRRTWHYDCEACLDTGFELRTCYPEQGPCGMRSCKGAREHRYTVRCACWNTNRTLQRMRERTFGAAASA